VEINYEIHDKELLAIVDTFKHWRCYCQGATHQVQVLLDHHNQEYFTTTKVLNCRQARWAQELAGIDFKIFYRPGWQNGKPIALSRRLEYRPEKGGGRKPASHDSFGKKSLRGTINEIIHLFLGTADITPEKKVDGGIPGKRQGGREEGRSL